MAKHTDRLTSALADRYRIERRLGEGGMATVYLAEDLKHQRKVALKVLRPELAAVLGAERFVQEITTTASLQHPHILPLFDSGEARVPPLHAVERGTGGEAFLYYVMPYIEGETLRDRLNRETQLGIDEAVKITTEIADALDYAHRQGVIHRDIKPENILLHDGRPMVADFGIALAVSAAAGGRMTETGLSLGTPHYMSPEQATAEKDLTNRSDIYSLGSVLYEMLTGEPPHMGNSAQQIIMKIVTDTPRPVTELRKSVPPNVTAAVAKSLEKLPADRFDTASRFAEALTDQAFTLPTMQAASGVGVQAGDRWKRLSVAGFGLAALMAALFVWALSRPEPPRPVTRYSVALPEEEALRINGSNMDLSADGSRLAYRAEDGAIWVRELDQLNAAPLRGADDADTPFFSPDGSRIAFYDTPERSWRVGSLGGGPPITIVDEASGTARGGGTWGSDGYVFVPGSVGAGLVRVPEAGGTPEPVTMLDAEQGETQHIWPEALPGGQGIVFTVRRGSLTDFDRWDIAVADLTTGTHSVLMAGVRAVYAETGHLLYVTADGTLMAVPFDRTSMTLTGDAVALVEGIRIGFAGNLGLTVSTTGTLFYHAGAMERANGEMVWVSREGTAEVIDPGWTGDFSHPSISPDGTRLALDIGENEGRHIWVKALDRGPLPKMTSTGSQNRRPAWTSDGRNVIFTSNRGDNDDLYVRRADASAPAELLLDEEEMIPEATYSPDGTWLVFRKNAPTPDIYGLQSGGDGVPVELVATEFRDTQPAVSPDGRWLAYTSNETGLNQVYVRPFPNTNDFRWQVSTDGGRSPVWAHSGRELFYRASGNMMSVAILPGTNFVTGERRVLFSAQGYRSSSGHPQYDVAPDDQRFVMIRSESGVQDSELIVVENFFEVLKERVGNE